MQNSDGHAANNFSPIQKDDTFRFSCAPQVPCFNACCRDLNQFLTPYDIVRLKDHLQLASSDFLEQYCRRHTGPESGLPIVSLKPGETEALTCPFVTEAGCKVYANRPSSCRTYPLARTLSRSRTTGAIFERFMLISESHCLGFRQGRTQTVRQWIARQEIGIYNDFNDRLMEIISLKSRFRPGPLDKESSHWFYLALYDLDSFRSEINQHGLLKGLELDAALLAEAQKEDTALLRVGIEWVKRALFGVDL